MADSTSILNSLNLKGLEQAIKQSNASSTGGAAKSLAGGAEDLGPLSDLVGTWVGTGFNLVQLPNRNLMHTDAPIEDKFRVVVNKTTETLEFKKIDGGILNRGNAQEDITFFGLHYLQQVNDVILNQGIHLETGLFLNIPKTTKPASGPTVARLGSIPHGDALLAQGIFGNANGGPKIDVADTTPLIVGTDGVAKPDTAAAYIDLIFNTPLPPGIPAGSAKNPNLVLTEAIKNQKIVNTTFIVLETKKDAGGIVNIPFVNTNARANDFSAVFWIEEVEDSSGNFLQLQYTQTLFLDFEVANKKGEQPPLLNIKWPHISVATMRKQK